MTDTADNDQPKGTTKMTDSEKRQKKQGNANITRHPQWAVAVHEAAHAYVAMWYSVRLGYIDVSGTTVGNNEGICRTGMASVWAQAVVSAAGREGEVALRPPSPNRRWDIEAGAEEDTNCIDDYRPENMDPATWRSDVAKEARRIVRSGKAAITVLAEALLAKCDAEGLAVLSYPAIEALLAKADPRLMPVTIDWSVTSPVERSHWRIAVHEASHVYVARWYGCHPRGVSIAGNQGFGIYELEKASRWACAAVAAAGIQGEIGLIRSTQDDKWVAWEAAAEDMDRIAACCPENTDPITWESIVKKEALRVVRGGRVAIYALANALMTRRDSEGNANLSAREVSEVLVGADPRLAWSD